MTLVAEGVEFGYSRSRPVLRGVGLVLAPGAVTVIVGPNGAGKSTLLRVLLGLLKPWSGSVTLGGDDVARLRGRERAAALAYVPQRPSVAADFTARQVVALGRYALGADAGAVERALEAVDVADRATDAFATLSAGQQQRIALARALAQLDGPASEERARALLADEPISAMDPRHALGAMEALRRLASRGVAVGVVLHDLNTARRSADRAIVLGERGGVLAAGAVHDTLSPAVLGEAFRTPFVLIEGARGSALVPAAPLPGAAESG